MLKPLKSATTAKNHITSHHTSHFFTQIHLITKLCLTLQWTTVQTDQKSAQYQRTVNKTGKHFDAEKQEAKYLPQVHRLQNPKQNCSHCITLQAKYTMAH